MVKSWRETWELGSECEERHEREQDEGGKDPPKAIFIYFIEYTYVAAASYDKMLRQYQ